MALIPLPTISERAPAKVNLALQMLDKRDDGYHHLDSLITFLDFGDVLHAVEAESPDVMTLAVQGAFGRGLANDDNLIIRAARLLKDEVGYRGNGVEFVLEKRIPVGAGLGGGSADAAAALRLLNRMWNCKLSTKELKELAALLGADVPSCIESKPAQMQGIGEKLTPMPALPAHWQILLVYPNEPLATAGVYQSGKVDFSGALTKIPQSEADWEAALRAGTNDLRYAAESISSEVSEMLTQLGRIMGSLAVRMSGSGSACFAVFDDFRAAQMAADHFAARCPNAWYHICRPVADILQEVGVEA